MRYLDAAGKGFAARSVEYIPGTSSSLVLTCEHASNFIPAPWSNLGLKRALLETHYALDIGAERLTRALAVRLAATAVLARYSRLFYDIKRPHDDVTCIRPDLGGIPVPGNLDATKAERRRRQLIARVPFDRLVSSSAALGHILVGIHSFSPVYDACRRHVEIGVLRDPASELGLTLLRALTTARKFLIGDNAPYNLVEQPVGCLQRIGDRLGAPFVVLEIRNDLLCGETQFAAITDCIASALEGIPRVRGAAGGAETRISTAVRSRMRLPRRQRRRGS